MRTRTVAVCCSRSERPSRISRAATTPEFNDFSNWIGNYPNVGAQTGIDEDPFGVGSVYRVHNISFRSTDPRIGSFHHALGCVAGIIDKFALLLAGWARFGRSIFLESITAILAFPTGHDCLLVVRLQMNTDRAACKAAALPFF